jgi:hypothetical protein
MTGYLDEMTARAAMAADMQYAEKTLLAVGEHRPLFALRKSDTVMLVPVQFTNEKQKERTLHILWLVAVVHDICASTFIGEVWVAARKPGDGLENVSTSEREDKREGVAVILTYLDEQAERKTMGDLRLIERDDDGKPVRLVESRLEAAESIDGRFTEIVPIPPPEGMRDGFAEEMRDLARVALKALGIEIHELGATMGNA